MLYNSALKNGTQRETAPPVERFDLGGSTGRRWNIITEPPPAELYGCDVVYCEPPFPAGIKVFDARAGQSTSSYADFAAAFARVWRGLQVPAYAVVNARLLAALPPPSGVVRIKLNGASERLAWWGGPAPVGNTNLQVCRWLGLHFRRIADITCGYGLPVIEFCKAGPGNTFFATDYDARCIGVLQRLANENLQPQERL